MRAALKGGRSVARYVARVAGLRVSRDMLQALSDTDLLGRFREIQAQDKARAAVRRRASRRQRFIYVFSTGDRIKIGISNDWQERLRCLASHCGSLRVLAVVRGTLADERALHKRFAALRLFGEWYRETAELLQWVAGLRSVIA